MALTAFAALECFYACIEQNVNRFLDVFIEGRTKLVLPVPLGGFHVSSHRKNGAPDDRASSYRGH